MKLRGDSNAGVISRTYAQVTSD